MEISIGRIVLYQLTEEDAKAINRRRPTRKKTSKRNRSKRQSAHTQAHVGNSVKAGDIFPMIVTKVWDTSGLGSINGQVLLDGSDCLWVTNVKECLGINPDGLFIAPGYWGWPQIKK